MRVDYVLMFSDMNSIFYELRIPQKICTIFHFFKDAGHDLAVSFVQFLLIINKILYCILIDYLTPKKSLSRTSIQRGD